MGGSVTNKLVSVVLMFDDQQLLTNMALCTFISLYTCLSADGSVWMSVCMRNLNE